MYFSKKKNKHINLQENRGEMWFKAENRTGVAIIVIICTLNSDVSESLLRSFIGKFPKTDRNYSDDRFTATGRRAFNQMQCGDTTLWFIAACSALFYINEHLSVFVTAVKTESQS